MTYRIVAHPGVQKEIEKLFKKDKVRYEDTVG
jgi:mRNA-degrading endonuclease RelE of RelBE toxin-antitoxin system